MNLWTKPSKEESENRAIDKAIGILNRLLTAPKDTRGFIPRSSLQAQKIEELKLTIKCF